MPFTKTPRTGRPRSAAVDAAIHQAAFELLRDGGFAALTMEAIAVRAGVSKATLYRRYGSPAAVVIGLVAVLDAEAVQVPDTGSVREDLLGVSKGLVRLLKKSAFGGIVAALVGAAAVHEELNEAVTSYVARRRLVVEEAIRRGIDRGELPPDTDPHFVLDLILGPFYFRHLISKDPITNAFAERVCDSALTAAGARSPNRQTPS
jgi:AcrR family transcriptional regulator